MKPIDLFPDHRDMNARLQPHVVLRLAITAANDSACQPSANSYRVSGKLESRSSL